MIKQYEELSPIAQTSLDNLRNEILRGDVELSMLERTIVTGLPRSLVSAQVFCEARAVR